MQKKIVVLGSINQDLVIQLDRIPLPGETLFGNTLHYFAGGKGSNQAIAAKKLGGDVIFLGKVGDDPFGNNLRNYLRGLGLDQHIRIVPGATGTAVINVDKQGENAISVIAGANSFFDLGDLEILSSLTAGDILLLQNEINVPVIYAAIEAAHDRGILVYYNPAPAIAIPDEIAGLCDCILVNEHELQICFRLAPREYRDDGLDELLLQLSGNYNTTLVLTLGRRGSKAAEKGRIINSPAIPVVAVDTTGAGDCFCGALVAHISRGNALEASLDFANKAAALSVTKMGASGSFPLLGEVL